MIKIAHELRDIRAVDLVKHKQRIPTRLIWERCHRQMCTCQAFGAIDSESLIRGYGGALGVPADIVTTDAKVLVLHIEKVRVTHRAVLEYRDRHGA